MLLKQILMPLLRLLLLSKQIMMLEAGSVRLMPMLPSPPPKVLPKVLPQLD